MARASVKGDGFGGSFLDGLGSGEWEKREATKERGEL